MSLRDEARQVRRELESNPMGQAKAQRSAAKVDDLERDLRLLGNRVTVMEALLAQALGLPPDKLQQIIDHGVRELSRPKTIEELARETSPCPTCGRNVHKSLKNCQVCGAAANGAPG